MARAESAAEPPSPRGAGARPQPVEMPPLAPANLDLKVAERLVYDVRVGGVPAGKAQMTVQREENFGGDTGPKVWKAALETRSSRAFSLFYEVRDLAKTCIDQKGGFSRSFNIEKREGDVKTTERIAFKYEFGNMEAAYERPRSDNVWRLYKIPLQGKVLDPLSAVYYLRALSAQAAGDKPGVNLKNARNGDAIHLPICTDRRVWLTKVNFGERRVEDFGGLKGREVIAVEPECEFKGLFERKGRIKVWVDVKTGIPLKMVVEIPIGTAEVQLSEHADSPLDE